MDKKESGKERKRRGGKRLKKGRDRKRQRIRDGADGGWERGGRKGFGSGRSREKELGYAKIKREKTGKIKAKVGRKNKALKEWNLINEILENEKEEDNFDLELPKDNYIEDLLKVLDIKHEEQISKLRSIREDLMKHNKEGEIFAKIDGIRKFYNKPTKTRIPLVTSEGYWVDANCDRSRH
ncbi:unnamed protein product [Moneuplotes crassus]|uniref:Uncharacterized protein n=1 Tax=Euplotes crassus TaxID=5936 RepID=A0AAD1UKF9_EUPCR|nr:unnamed protein product [Moneuplotes crassus]